MPAPAAHSTLVNRLTATSSSASLSRALAVLLAVAATAAAAQFTVTLPFTPVPSTLQPMVVLLAGAALGSRLGATAQAAYLLAGIIGLPVFAASPLLPQGAARLLGPTGGYLLAYPLAAFVVGWLTERGWDRGILTAALAMAAGLVVIYTGGVSWLTMAFQQPLGVALGTGVAPFLLADVLKIVAAAILLPQAWKLLR
jgi:biotin transport system substrate-specific component